MPQRRQAGKAAVAREVHLEAGLVKAATEICVVAGAAVLGGLAARVGRGAAVTGARPAPMCAQGRGPQLAGAALAALAVGSAWQRPLWSGPGVGLSTDVIGLLGVLAWACLLVAVGVADLCWMRVPPALWRAGAPAVCAGALVGAGTSGCWVAAARGAAVGLVGAVVYYTVAVLRPGRLGANELLRIAERRYRERGVHALLLDEAQHMALARSIVDLRHNLDILKSFANKTGVRIVLVGAYELLQFHQASAQLARRIPSVHLPRYRWTVQHERAEFERVCRQMLGCIGYLRDWLVSAEHEFRTSGRSWSACLAAAAASEVTVNSMLDEIEPAETRAEATVTGRKKLRLRLGLTAVRQSGTGKSAAAGKNAVAGAPRSRRRAGRRAPRRDAVGDQHG